MIAFAQEYGPFFLSIFMVSAVTSVLANKVLSRHLAGFRFSKRLSFSLAGLFAIQVVAMNLFSAQLTERQVRTRVQAAVQQPAGPSTSAMPAPVTNRSPDQLKQDFLQTVEAAALQTESITPQAKQALYQQFSALFPNGDKDRLEYARQIGHAYECQRAVFEDALATLKSKKVVRSKVVERCEAESGAFFGREKLVPKEIAKANVEMLNRLAKAKPDDKDLPSEDALRGALDQQVRRIDGVRRLLE